MSYELVLQARTQGAPFDMARVDALLAARPGTDRSDGVREWDLGVGTVEVLPLRDGKRVVGAELRVPLVDGEELIREVLTEAAGLAHQAQLRLFDPQLGEVLTGSATERVVEQYLRTEHYRRTAKPMEITPGLAEAMDRAERVQSLGLPSERMSLSSRLVLFAVGGFALLFFVMRFLMEKLNGE
ncbi:hypothetical protein HRD49_44110 [Corallococcus exiguus]|uniref:hypothetical protein n=2 Tax=Myxococcaceae TaxID=31 RepID=UPI000F889CC2|nr:MULTISPECIES: hypothetical protein [Corallococcus]NNC19405.1 hypothetical protein [Corallococcus exiguus]NRD56793.1 hypothetical protein [Corallococcus exiguus]NRD68723.1 hypothetical protein [Corallococcus exiguus]